MMARCQIRHHQRVTARLTAATVHHDTLYAMQDVEAYGTHVWTLWRIAGTAEYFHHTKYQ